MSGAGETQWPRRLAPEPPVLAASTLGAPDLSLEQFTGALRRVGIHALELRLAGNGIAWDTLTEHEAGRLRDELLDFGVTPISLASYISIAKASADGDVLADLRRVVELASWIAAPVVRVFPGALVTERSSHLRPSLNEPEDEVANRAAQRIDAVSEFAQAMGVTVAIETHDSHPRAQDIVRILERVTGPVGVIWDVLHPWRTGEPVEETARLLQPWLAQPGSIVQIKDAESPTSLSPVLLGRGTVPLDKVARTLSEIAYGGTISLEWEKAWYPAAEPIEAALESFTTWANSTQAGRGR